MNPRRGSTGHTVAAIRRRGLTTHALVGAIFPVRHPRLTVHFGSVVELSAPRTNRQRQSAVPVTVAFRGYQHGSPRNTPRTKHSQWDLEATPTSFPPASPWGPLFLPSTIR